MYQSIGKARVIREIARQGLLPYPEFFASTKPFGTPLGPILMKYVLTVTVILVVPAADAFSFLLDHPRRCFILLFPRRQTWFLLAVIITVKYVVLHVRFARIPKPIFPFSVADWAAFMILDVGIPQIEAIPTGIRLLLGVVQAVAVSFSHFAHLSRH